MPGSRALGPRRIVLAIFLPMLVAGLAIGILANHLLAPPLLNYMRDSVDAQLKMASGMGLAICDSVLEQILSRRLEDAQEELTALKREALAEIGELSHQFPNLAVLVVDQSGAVLISSLRGEFSIPKLRLGPLDGEITTTTIQGHELRLHRRYFPFWRWNIVSLITEESYRAPGRMAEHTVYLATFGVLLVVLLALLVTLHWLVNRPLTRVIEATREIAEGRFTQVPVMRQDELGQVAESFNLMVASLAESRSQLESALARLGESEEQYRTLTENALAMVTIVQKGRFVFVNRMMCDKTGYSQAELLGRPVMDLVHPEDQPQVLQGAAQAAASEGQEAHYDFRYLSADGQEHWAEMQATRIMFRGQPAVLGHAIDITARKEAQAEQARLQQRLEHAQRMELVGTLAGGVSHDFNNILQAITGFAQIMLLRAGRDANQQSNLHSILKACRRASELVNQLLTFSRRAEPHTRSLDLNQEVAQVARVLERTIPRMISVQTNLDPGLQRVIADPTQIEQVLMNLGNNARDAMPQGGRLLFETCNVHLDERYSAQEAGITPGNYVLVKVSDTGTGIAKETLPRIFEPFFTTKGLGEGTGLGLSTVYGIVKSHQGHITCYSELGRGTLFKVYLPADERAAPVEEAPAPAALDLPRGGETVLLVDDEPALLEVAQEMLAQYGYRMLTAQSGEQALEVQQGHEGRIDLVIMDLGMPGMGGRACLERLRQLAPDLPVIIATGYSAAGQEAEMQRAGAAGFLAKPYQMVELLLKVRQVLDRAKA